MEKRLLQLHSASGQGKNSIRQLFDKLQRQRRLLGCESGREKRFNTFHGTKNEISARASHHFGLGQGPMCQRLGIHPLSWPTTVSRVSF